MSKMMITKRIGILTTGAVVTLALFVFMAKLVDTEHPTVAEQQETPDFEIALVNTPPKDATKKQRIEPKAPLVTPEKPTLIPSDTPNTIQIPVVEIPHIQLAPQGYNKQPMDGDALPVVQVSPRYPLKARRDGKEGYVILGFDIDAAGNVVNISIIESNPKRIFNKAAKQAIKNWKYKPKMVNGKPSSQLGQQVQLDFKLEQQI